MAANHFSLLNYLLYYCQFQGQHGTYTDQRIIQIAYIYVESIEVFASSTDRHTLPTECITDKMFGQVSYVFISQRRNRNASSIPHACAIMWPIEPTLLPPLLPPPHDGSALVWLQCELLLSSWSRPVFTRLLRPVTFFGFTHCTVIITVLLCIHGRLQFNDNGPDELVFGWGLKL